MTARAKFVDEDESIDGWTRMPSVIPFEYDADGEREAVEEIENALTHGNQSLDLAKVQ